MIKEKLPVKMKTRQYDYSSYNNETKACESFLNLSMHINKNGR